MSSLPYQPILSILMTLKGSNTDNYTDNDQESSNKNGDNYTRPFRGEPYYQVTVNLLVTSTNSMIRPM